jgi:hypothetical protein
MAGWSMTTPATGPSSSMRPPMGISRGGPLRRTLGLVGRTSRSAGSRRGRPETSRPSGRALLSAVACASTGAWPRDPQRLLAGDVAKHSAPRGRRFRVEHWADALHWGPATAPLMIRDPRLSQAAVLPPIRIRYDAEAADIGVAALDDELVLPSRPVASSSPSGSARRVTAAMIVRPGAAVDHGHLRDARGAARSRAYLTGAGDGMTGAASAQ